MLHEDAGAVRQTRSAGAVGDGRAQTAALLAAELGRHVDGVAERLVQTLEDALELVRRPLAVLLGQLLQQRLVAQQVLDQRLGEDAARRVRRFRFLVVLGVQRPDGLDGLGLRTGHVQPVVGGRVAQRRGQQVEEHRAEPVLGVDQRLVLGLDVALLRVRDVHAQRFADGVLFLSTPRPNVATPSPSVSTRLGHVLIVHHIIDAQHQGQRLGLEYLVQVLDDLDHLSVGQQDGRRQVVHLADAGEGLDGVLEQVDLGVGHLPVGGQLGRVPVSGDGQAAGRRHGRHDVDAGQRIRLGERRLGQQPGRHLGHQHRLDVTFHAGHG